MDVIELGSDEPVAKQEKEADKPKPKTINALNADVLQDVDVSLTAIVGRGATTVRRLLELEHGSVVELDTPLDGHVKLELNGRLIATGELVAVGDKFGVRIARIVAEKQ